MEHKQNYRSFIINELERRQKKNPAYSLRAFARDLGIPCSRLSEIINRKMGLSQARAVNLADKLSLSPSEKEFFLDLALSEHARSPVVKEMANNRVRARHALTKEVGENEFSIISDWYHHAILEYLQLPSVPHSIEAIAKHFGLSVDETEKALERLEQVQLLEKKEGRYEVRHERRAAIFRPGFKAVHNFYDQLLNRVRDNIGTESRHWDMSAMMIQVKKEDVRKAIDKIRQFRRELMTELESNPDRDSVFCMTVQFFNLTELDPS